MEMLKKWQSIFCKMSKRLMKNTLLFKKNGLPFSEKFPVVLL